MAFFRKNKNKAAENTPVEEKPEIQNEDTVNEEENNSSNEPLDYGLNKRVAKAIDNIIPVISNGDLNLIPSVYKAEVLSESVHDADLDDILVLAEYTNDFMQKDEKHDKGFAATFLNVLAAGIAAKIKSADKLYTIYSNLLRKPYPLISVGFSLIFFDENNAEEWAKSYTEAHESEVYVKALNGEEEIKNYFMELAALGIANIGVEPTKSKIIINHKPIYGFEFETVADSNVQFLSLRFIQLDKSKIFHDSAKRAHGELLSAIIASKFICPGKTINGNFVAASLQRGDVSFISLFTDKRELAATMAENPSAKEFLEQSELRELSFAEMEKFLMAPQISALTINISGMGFTIKRDIYENLYKAIKANPGKKVAIQVE